MRYCTLLVTAVMLPWLVFASTVYKAEDPDGVVVLSDHPIKGTTHQESMQLDTVLHSKSTPAKHARSGSDANTDIKQAQNDVEKAQYELTAARAQQLKAAHECKELRRQNPNTNNPCLHVDTTEEEEELSRSQDALQALTDKMQDIG